MPKTILITGAGSGFGEGAAIGMAKNGHNVIATVQVSPQVTPLREKAKALGLNNLTVERLDLTDPYDIAQAQSWDFDVLWNNAGRGEAGPVWEIPVDLVRQNYEINVFLPLVLTQGVVRKWVANKTKGKVVFTSSMGGLFTPANWGIYVSTKHALEAIAEAMQQELAPYGIKVQTINPGAYYTGYNETMADNPFRWLDDKQALHQAGRPPQGLRRLLRDTGRQDGSEGDDRPDDRDRSGRHGLFRNVVPKVIEDMLKQHQTRRLGATRSDHPDHPRHWRVEWLRSDERQRARACRPCRLCEPRGLLRSSEAARHQPSIGESVVTMAWWGALVALVLSISTAACGQTTGGSAMNAERVGSATARNRALVEASFVAWRDGTGSPYELLAENVNWTIVGRSDAFKSYPSREAFMSEVIRPFNARMRDRLRPTMRNLYADGDTVVIFFDATGVAKNGEAYSNTYAWFWEMVDGRVVRAHAFFDSIAFNELWQRVSPSPP